ncbi:MAG: hypothetical protein KBD01_19795, partial [Acidobacteria bacterium]|nr:hypothetical protein [Acidobacteriota bacterium]
EFTFHIAADGKHSPDEAYRIEVATDSDFENIVRAFDTTKVPGKRKALGAKAGGDATQAPAGGDATQVPADAGEAAGGAGGTAPPGNDATRPRGRGGARGPRAGGGRPPAAAPAGARGGGVTPKGRPGIATWSYGSEFALEDVPEEYRPTNHVGIYCRARGQLQDGTYFWRASKSIGGGEWSSLGDPQEFVIDTVPPATVDSIRMDMRSDGTLRISWDPVWSDQGQNSEHVAGYRVYRYDKILKRYPLMTRYLVGETQESDVTLDVAENDPKLVFYRVQAVDSVGNEEGRPRPAPIGAFDLAFEAPDFDQLADPAYLKQLNQEERDRQK